MHGSSPAAWTAVLIALVGITIGGVALIVTLLVNPDESERLTLAANEGKIQLALRNPLDKENPATKGVKPGALLGTPRPVRKGPRALRSGQAAGAGAAAPAPRTGRGQAQQDGGHEHGEQPRYPCGQARPVGGGREGEAEGQDEGGIDRAGEEPLQRDSRPGDRGRGEDRVCQRGS